MKAVYKTEISSAWYGELIEDAKLVLKNHPLWRVHFIHREGNQVANVMAKLELDSKPVERLWLHNFLCIMLQTVLSDSAN